MRRTFVLVWLVLVVLGAGGCAIIGGSESHEGGSASLTDAAHQAGADSVAKRRRLDVGATVPSESESGSGAEVSVANDLDEARPRGTHRAPGPVRHDPWHVGVIVGGGAMGGGTYDGFTVGGLQFGTYVGERLRVDLGAYAIATPFNAGTLAGSAFDDPFELALDLSARWYLTGARTLVGVYPIGGVRFGTLFWDYRTAPVVTSDGRTHSVTSDYLNNVSLYAGFGTSLVQTSRFMLGAHLTGGVRLHGFDTHEGFSNTLFPPTGFVQLLMETEVRF